MVAGLAGGHLPCEGTAMPSNPPESRPPQQAGGCLIAAGLMIGPIVGLVFGQTSMGLIGGLAIGVIAAIIMAVRDSR